MHEVTFVYTLRRSLGQTFPHPSARVCAFFVIVSFGMLIKDLIHFSFVTDGIMPQKSLEARGRGWS